MPVTCPGCGRLYEDARFPLGRTIHCACGARVGPAHPVSGQSGSPPRFIADAMLGRLARWLRLLGLDTVYEADIADAEIVRRGVTEGRIILSRDRALPVEWRVSDLYLVDAERPLEQLREVAERFGLAEGMQILTRCSQCNAQLLPASRNDAAGHVPPRVLHNEQSFMHCPTCGRFYWSGSHVKRIRRIVGQALQAPKNP